MHDITPEQAAGAITTLMVLLSQIAAILGKPEIIKGVRILSLIWDAMAANYGKAKNKEP